MKLFVSYAHVNLPRVQQLANFLNLGGHEVWFDQRLVGGQSWKDQLRTQIKTSDCFLYALTPESFASDWCQWEFSQAVHMGKKVVTVLLEPCRLKGILGEYQYIDFTQGDSLEAGLRLGTAVFAAQPISPELVPLLPAPDDTPPEREIAHGEVNDNPLVQRVYDEAFQAYRGKDYEEALELVHDCLLLDAQHGDAQNLLVVLERRMERGKTQSPAKLAWTRSARSRVLDLLPEPFTWIDIPAGRVEIEDGHGEFDVAAFQIAKYPITNAQYAKFIEAGGYRERKWWIDAGWEAREKGWTWNSGKSEWKPTGNPWTEPRYWADSRFNGREQPVVGVSWYEAVAFCLWLSEMTGEGIVLPTEDQWQYAAQGDDGRVYPWGNEWGCQRCNNSVEPCDSDATTSVRQYEGADKGNSPFGVVDMAGNVWEWCLTDYENRTNDVVSDADMRVLRGGAWISGFTDLFHCVSRHSNLPHFSNYHWGFRVSCS